jgi:hypothetical protein
MPPLFSLEDENTLITATRTKTQGQPALRFFAQGDFDRDSTGVEFVVNVKDAYAMAQDIAKTLGESYDADEVVVLRLNDDITTGEVDIEVTRAMAADLSRQLLQRLGN